MGGPSILAATASRCLTACYKAARPFLRERSGNRILMYHAVGTQVAGDALGLYNISPARFESHMRILSTRHRDSIRRLDPESLKLPEPGFMLTFDDGYLDNLTRAYPVLSHLGIPFTVFVTTEPVLKNEAGYLGEKELRELDSLDGVTIGAHGVTHVPLAECGESQLREELTGSKAYLEDLLGHPVDAISYPHGSVNRRVRDAAEQAGFRFGASSHFDINLPDRDPLLLCRTDIWSGDSDSVFSEKLAGEWDWRRWRHQDPGGTQK
jgi:peptidoglycan/xylan/chitin deacetylase (PgdA/CDA1 family)